jgi:hypothetical protein
MRTIHRRVFASFVASCFVASGLLAACDTTESTGGGAGTPVGDAALDAVTAPDVTVAPDAQPAVDAGVDASVDAGLEAATDAGLEAATDAGVPDAAVPTTCTIGGNPVPANTINAANDCQICTPALSSVAWSPRASFDLLVGGTDPVAQGWVVSQNAPATLSLGADYAELATSNGAQTSGTLLLSRANTFLPGMATTVRIVLQVVSVNPHNLYDSAAAILLGYTPPAPEGTIARGQMIYLDSNAIGFTDDTQTAASTVVDGAYHTFDVSLDAADTLRVSMDNVAKLTRANATRGTGVLGIGDQTNDQNVNATMRIRSVKKICP